MNKSDLKDGMTLVYRNGCKVDYYKEHLLDFESEGIGKMDSFNDDLTHKEHDFWDVCKIIEDDSVIWEREKEIDWSKVPLGTKVVVSNDAFFTEKVMYFINKTGDYYFVVDKKRINTDYFKYCKLVEEQKEEVTYKEMK